MRFTNLLHLYRIRLRARLVAELLALAGIAVGVALVFAALVASTSLTGSVRQLNEGIVGEADLQLVGRGVGGFPQRVFDRVTRVRGVDSAAPVAEARINLAGPAGLRSVLLVGADPGLAGLGGDLLQRATSPERHARLGLLLPAPLAAAVGAEVGRPVGLQIGAASRPVPVVGVLERSQIGSLVESPVAVAPLALVQRLAARPGRVNRIFVNSTPGQEDAARRALSEIAAGRLDVVPADREVTVFEQAALPTNQSTGLFSALSAMVGFLFAISAMLLTVPQRRRLIAELRVAGYQPWVVVELLLFDALMLGLAGSLLGLVLGDQVSRHLFAGVPGFLASAFPIGSQRIVTWESIAIAAVAGNAAACVAVLTPVRDALARNPVRKEVRTQASRWGPWLAVGAAAPLALAIGIAIYAPSAAVLSVASLTLSLLLLFPVLLRLAIAGFDRVGNRIRSPVAILSVLELHSGAARIRTLAVAATGAIAVYATVAIGGAHADLQRGLDGVSTDLDRGVDVWISGDGSANVFSTSSFEFPSRRIGALERLPGVNRVRRHRGGFLDVENYRAWVLAPPRAQGRLVPGSQLRGTDEAVVNGRLRAGGWLVLSKAIASQLGVGVGDRVALPTPGPSRFRVAGLSTNLGWPGGAIVLNAGDFARAWSTRSVTSLAIEAEPGASPELVARSVERALGPGSPLRVETQAERVGRLMASSRAGLARLSQISAMVIVAAMLAMTVAMGGSIWQRRQMIAALKVHGFSERELWRALLLESGLLLGTGCLIGAAFGLLGQMLLNWSLEDLTGFPVVYTMAVPVAAVVLALITGVAVAVLAVPGWFAVRVRPVAGLPT